MREHAEQERTKPVLARSDYLLRGTRYDTDVLSLVGAEIDAALRT